MRSIIGRLDVSVETSEPRGFVERTGAFVCCTDNVHRIPHSTFVTIAIRPS